jgi:hypothetical protein
LIAVKAVNMAEVGKFMNMDMSKITKWSEENDISFYDQKSKVTLISRRCKERKQLIYT